MRMPSRKKESASQQRREQWRRSRMAAQTVRSAFPAIELIRVELKFQDMTRLTPAAQSYVLHPPARAFFEFPCPYADCDGQFDLGPVATLAATATSSHAEGTLECSGSRSRDGLQKQACGLRTDYAVDIQYIKAPEPIR